MVNYDLLFYVGFIGYVCDLAFCLWLLIMVNDTYTPIWKKRQYKDYAITAMFIGILLIGMWSIAGRLSNEKNHEQIEKIFQNAN